MRSILGHLLSTLLYPCYLVWNTLLFYAEQRQPPGQLPLLRWHSAFWDKYQRFPLFGLDDHLVFVAERHPAAGQAAIYDLANGPQRWAAQVAQIELYARQLERCADIETIRRTHLSLVTSELTGAANTLLRIFSEYSRDLEAALSQPTAYHQRLALSAAEKRLDNLQRELTLSNEPYAVRFYPVATRWYQIVTDYRRQLAQVAELNQEIDNPYIFGVPLTEQQEIFVGRTDIVARIEQLLLDRQRPPLLLYGQRRMGKTSLLQNLAHSLPSTLVPLYVDGETISGVSDYPDFLYNVAKEVSRSANRQNLTLPALPREAIAINPFTCFNEWLDRVEQTLTGQGRQMALLALDEFEALNDVLNKEHFDEYDILRLLRHLIQHRPYFKLLLAGSHTFEEFRDWAGYLINTQVVQVSYLEQEEARQLIEQPVKTFTLQYEAEATQRILELTRGHPYLIQLLCYELVTLKNKQAPSLRQLARLADVEAAGLTALNRGSFFFTDIEQNQVNPEGQNLLRFLARQGERVPLSQEVMIRHFGSSDDLDQILNLLIRRDLIEPIDGGYCFQVELIRRWFAR